MTSRSSHGDASAASVDPLACYLRCVQHPDAEVGFLYKAYMTHRGRTPTKLKEDFAGTSAIAAAWVRYHDANTAVAVERHRATVQWARHRATEVLPEDRLDALSILEADVRLVEEPRVDIVAAMNFSVFELHDRDSLRAYFKTARSSLLSQGVLVFDMFGGPGAMRPGTQSRPAPPVFSFIDAHDDAPEDDAHNDEAGPAAATDAASDAASTAVPDDLTYHWEQRSYDAVTGRIDCRIHFGSGDRIVARDAFVYDWRLWTLPELLELLREAGFSDAAVWCDAVDHETGESDGSYEPVEAIPAREDYVAYVVALK